MPLFKRRGNLVNFRLTDEEYESLRLATSACGAHSLSEYVRDAVLRSVKSNIRENPSGAARPSNMEGHISDLESTIRHLTGLLEEIGGAFAREARKRAPSAPDEETVSIERVHGLR